MNEQRGIFPIAKWRRSLLLLLVLQPLLTLALSAPAKAQFWSSVGGRLLSRDGRWLSPVNGGLLSSSEDDHLRRGSVNAWDISVPLGTLIFPMAAGKVSYAGCNNAGGYGCWVLVDHEDGYLSLYAHMIDEGGGRVKVQTGDRVNAWSPLGRVGWTGMTSFGPHIHWEIHHATKGRMRNDLFFMRSSIAYCKFCDAGEASLQAAGVTGAYAYSQYLFSREALIGLLLLLCAFVLFFRPEVALVGMQAAGLFLYNLFHVTQSVWYGARERNRLHWVGILLIFLAPTLLCGSGTALAVWMADEEITVSVLFDYLRYGLYPYPGQGYQLGARYSAVWGMPCQNVGTLGEICDAPAVVEKTLAWQRDVQAFSQATPIAVAIPRLGGRFGFSEARRLLNEMHYVGGLVVVDMGGEFKAAHEAIDQLVRFGLDGIAIDMEFIEKVQAKDVRWLAEHLARSRRDAGLNGQGVLVLWNVFHNVELTGDLTVEGVQIVPIFTGYGPTASKVAGLAHTQHLFEIDPLASGLMAFDQRWPVNTLCKKFDTTHGFDCQNWRALFSHPGAQGAGWWVQQ